MIGYVTLGTNDKAKAKAFYSALLQPLGANCFEPNDRLMMWMTADGGPILAVGSPWDEQPATVGNGVMVALKVDGKDDVDAMHKNALALGGQDEGEPGHRTDNFYGAYFRDLDGNKFAVYYMV